MNQQPGYGPPGYPPQAAPPPKKQSFTTRALLAVVGVFLAYLFFSMIGRSLGYGGIALGLLGVGGCVAARMKLPKFRAASPWGIGLFAMITLFSVCGAKANQVEKQQADAAASAQAAQAAAAAETARKQAEQAKADRAAAMAAVEASTTPADISAACTKVEAHGGVLPDIQQKCGDAFLTQGQALFTAGKAEEALPLLETAVRLSLTKDAATAALTKAKAVVEKKTAAAEKAAAKQSAAEEKARLAQRKFIGAGPEGVMAAIMAKNDPEELWSTQYAGKYVRWNAKWERTGMLVKFVASTGDFTSLSCEDFDPAHDPTKFDDLKQFDRIVVEGQLNAFKKQMGKDKLEFTLTECIARKQ